MAAHLFFSPDAAAPSGKNVPTAPGSTEQSRNRTEEPQMVDTTTRVREAVTVAYEPREWNQLISMSRGNVLRDVADTLTDNADVVSDLVAAVVRKGGDGYAFAVRAQVYREVAAQLRHVAFAEQAPALGLCPDCGEAL
jgi:hypothetical protein